MDCSPPGPSVQGDSPGKNPGVGCHALLQGIFPTQGSNAGHPRCRQILYHLRYQGSPQGDMQGLISPIFISPIFRNSFRIGCIPFRPSCLRMYCFKVGVPAFFFFNGICIGHAFLAFPEVPLTHTSGLAVS